MDETLNNLISFLIFGVAFVIWIYQGVKQAKKRQEETSDTFSEEDEDIFQETPTRQGGSQLPAPPPQRPANPMEDLQRQLEDFFGVPPEKRKTVTPPAPTLEKKPPRPVVPTPVAPTRSSEPPRPRVQPVPQAPTAIPEKPKRSPFMERLQQKFQSKSPKLAGAIDGVDVDDYESTLHGAGKITDSERLGTRPVRKTRRLDLARLNPDPIKNAIIVAEIIKPYSRGPLRRRNMFPWQ